MAKQLERWGCNTKFKSRPDHKLDLFTVVPSSNPPPCLSIANWFVPGQLGFLKLFKFDLNYLFKPFARQ